VTINRAVCVISILGVPSGARETSPKIAICMRCELCLTLVLSSFSVIAGKVYISRIAGGALRMDSSTIVVTCYCAQGMSLRSAGVETSSMCRNAGAIFSI
jgi:hypothetical protein